MLGVAIAAGKWLLAGNWKWAVPSAIAAAAVLWGGLQRFNYLECKAERATSIATAEAKVRAALVKDQELGNRLVADYAGEIAQLQGSLQDALVTLARAQRTPGCDRSPAARAFDDGLSQLDRETGAGQPDAAGTARPTMPKAAAPAR